MMNEKLILRKFSSKLQCNVTKVSCICESFVLLTQHSRVPNPHFWMSAKDKRCE